jgi:hypothetical protein
MTFRSQTTRLLAGVLVAGLSVGTSSALAADFGDGTGDHRRPYFSGSDDHGERHGGYKGDGRSHVDDDDDDEDRYTKDDRRHSDDDDDDDIREQAESSHRRHCRPGWRVKQGLERAGWTRFELAKQGEGFAVIRAERRNTGQPFLLTIDGCNGRTISSRPITDQPIRSHHDQNTRWSGYEPRR